MPTLIERLTGVLTEAEELIASSDKIRIHPFGALLNLQRKGKRADMNTIYSLTVAQNNQLGEILDLYNAAPDKTEFVRVFKDLMYLGESGIDPGFQVWITVRGALRTEVTDQGGTLP